MRSQKDRAGAVQVRALAPVFLDQHAEHRRAKSPGALVVIYLDLLITAPRGDACYSYLGHAADRFAGIQRRAPNNIPPNYQQPPHAALIITITTHIRDYAATTGTQGDGTTPGVRPQYVEVATISAGRGGGPAIGWRRT